VEYSTPPERSEAPKVLFFCRGRRHAVPDMVIAEELRRLGPGFAPVFASYGTGAATLAEGGHAVIDLQLKEDSPFIEILVAATRLVAAWEPDVVLSHEEFAALPPAKTFQVPTAFLVDFFLAPATSGCRACSTPTRSSSSSAATYLPSRPTPQGACTTRDRSCGHSPSPARTAAALGTS